MKRLVAVVAILLATLVCPSVLESQQLYRPPSIEVEAIEMEGVGVIYYGDHLAHPPDAEAYGELIKLLYGEMGMEIPSMYKIYILPYAKFEEMLAYIETSTPEDMIYWLHGYRGQQDTVVYAFIHRPSKIRGEVRIYMFEPSYAAFVHENLHYILYNMSTEGWMDKHSILIPMEQAFFTSHLFRDWLREYR